MGIEDRRAAVSEEAVARLLVKMTRDYSSDLSGRVVASSNLQRQRQAF